MKRIFTILVALVCVTSTAVLQSAPKAVKVALSYPNVSAYVMGTGEQLS